MANNLRLPPGFIYIQQAISGGHGLSASIIGIVIDLAKISPARDPGDFTLTFNVWDPTVSDHRGLTVRKFGKMAGMPPNLCVGDVILLTNLQIRNNIGLIALFNFKTNAVVFPAASLPGPNNDTVPLSYNTVNTGRFPGILPPSPQVQQYVLDLASQDGTVPTGDFRIHAPPQSYQNYQSSATPSYTHPIPAQSYQTPAPRGQYIPALQSVRPGEPVFLANGDHPPVKTNGWTAINRNPAQTNKKFRLLKDLNSVKVFADLVVEIVKIFPRTHQVGADLYVTDYTSNSLLFDYLSPEDEEAQHGEDRDLLDYGVEPKKRWSGPLGQYTMCLDVWPPHSDAVVHNFKEGECCLIRNVITKLSAKGSRLEARLSQDRSHPDQVNIRRLAPDDENFRRLKERKDEYFRRQSAKPIQHKDRAQKKKERKVRQAKEAEERLALEQKELYRDIPKSLLNTEEDSSSPPIKPLSNSNVVALHQSRKFTPLVDIVRSPHLKIPNSDPSLATKALPFTNARYRTLLRVIDFYPPSIADFSHCLSDETYNPPPTLPPDSDASDDDIDVEYQIQSLSQHQSRKWEWAFALRVEDALTPLDPNNKSKPTQITLNIPNASALFLLQMDACDLHKNKHALHQLQEKLFLLWGDLEELKRNEAVEGAPTDYEPSNQPFEACIVEYGVKDSYPESGWVRSWALDETKIK